MEEKYSILKDLIQKSQSIDEVEKKSIISNLQGFNHDDISNMIEIFTWEQEERSTLNKKNEKKICLLKDFSKNSLLKIKKLKNELIYKTEQKVEKDDKIKAERILNNK